MPRDDHKYVFVIGGVMSGVGKGITAASIGSILQDKGYKVNLVKADPYLNVDAGMMSPTEHGEAFVLKSGLETDQDMGNYERFLNRDQLAEDYITSGMVYRDVIERERRGEYGGKCVEAMPHILDEIIARLKNAAKKNDSDISVIEIGGTVGDYQNIMFIEAARVLKIYNPNNVLFVLVSFLPIPHKLGEMKTKPTQNAVRQLNSYGVQADILVARSEVELDQVRKDKIAISCNIHPERVISAPDIDSIYEVPLSFEKYELGNMILSMLSLRAREEGGLLEWRKFIEKTRSTTKKVRIAVVGKSFDSGDFVLSDAYVSLLEAVKFSAFDLGAEPEIKWFSAADFEKDKEGVNALSDFDGIIAPGGFGVGGTEGIIRAVEFARTAKIPFLGIGYGMQLALVEFARNILHLENANTAEVDRGAENPVISALDFSDEDQGQNPLRKKRLGSYNVFLKEGTLAKGIYRTEKVSERFRNNFSLNNDFRESLERAGVIFSGYSHDGESVEIAELSTNDHPFFLGTQFHPEFQARPLAPHPLFTAFVRASLAAQNSSENISQAGISASYLLN